MFGHWWFEGPQFIDFFYRKLHYDQNEIAAVTPGDFLDSGLPIQIQQPTASSWGENGYYKVWINEGNSWIYPYQHDAERRMTELADRSVAQGADHEHTGVRSRLLKQLARELLLAQSSDWAFQIYQGTTVQYSSRRFQSHIQRFDMLAKMLTASEAEPGTVIDQNDLELLEEIEHRDNIFSEIDPAVYRSK